MKFQSCLWLAFFLFLKSAAQEKVFDFDLSSENLPEILAVHIDSSNQHNFSHALVVASNQIKHIYLSQTGQKKEITMHLPEEKTLDKKLELLFKTNRYLLNVVFSDKIIDVIYSPAVMSYFFITTDINTGIFKITDTLKIKFPIKTVDCFRDADRIVLLHYITGKNKFVISEKKVNSKIKSDTIDINFPGGEKDFEIDNYVEFGSKLIIPAFDIWLPPYMLARNSHIFREGNRFRILINDKRFNTWLLNIDLLNKTYTTKKYNCPESSLQDEKGSMTSWITDSTLVRAYTKEDNLKIVLARLNSNYPFDSILITKDNFQKITTSDIIKTGDFWSKSNIESSDFSTFIKKAESNKPIISGYEQDNTLYLTLATKYNLLATSTLLGNIFTLGMMDFQQVKPPSLITFDLSYNINQKKFDVGSVKHHVWEKMMMFVWAVRTYMGTMNMQFLDDYYYISYFNFDRKHLYIYKFHKFIEK